MGCLGSGFVDPCWGSGELEVEDGITIQIAKP